MSDCEEVEPTREILFDRTEKEFFNDINNEVIERDKIVITLDPLPSEGLRILKDKRTDIRDYATKRNYDDFDYNNMLWEAYDILRDFYGSLNVWESLNLPKNDEETGVKFKKAVAKWKKLKLWRICPPDTFSYGSKLWRKDRWVSKDMPGYIFYSPVDVAIEDCTSKYLEKKWMCHPYVSWAIINAYLLNAGRMQICKFDDKYRDDVIISGLFRYKKSLTKVGDVFSKILETDVNFKKDVAKWKNEWKKLKLWRILDVGDVFSKILEPETAYRNYKTKIKKGNTRSVIISITLTIAVTIAFKAFTDYSKTANVIFCLGLLYAFADFICGRKELNKILEIDQMRNLLVALKEAWVAANSPAIDLTRIKDKVAVVEKMGYRYPEPFHVLLTDTIAKYGNTLSVMSWVSKIRT